MRPTRSRCRRSRQHRNECGSHTLVRATQCLIRPSTDGAYTTMLVLVGRALLLGVEPRFVEALAHALCDDAQYVRARLRRQFAQLLGMRETLLECLLCSVSIFGQTV